MRKQYLLAAACLLLSACGYSSFDNTLTGQIKRLHRVTPLVCGNRVDVDVSLGVMRNGVGSMSTQDTWMTVEDPEVLAQANAAAASGAVVEVTYRTARVAFCQNHDQLTGIKILSK